jgi:putative RNA 2'-phosphotransferase
MDRRTATRLSKFLSLVLRHRPDDYGLAMDEQGFVDFESLIDVLVAEDIVAETAEQDVLELVEGSERRRFEIEGGRIRALYGHSSRIPLAYPSDDPPEALWHGTTPEHAAQVRAKGLQPAGRAFVHLSSTEEEARAVGGRHSEHPVLVRIDTRAAREHGIDFHQATELIWLCRSLPPEACVIPEDVPDGPPPQSPSPSTATGSVTVVPAAQATEFKRRMRKKGSRR